MVVALHHRHLRLLHRLHHPTAHPSPLPRLMCTSFHQRREIPASAWIPSPSRRPPPRRAPKCNSSARTSCSSQVGLDKSPTLCWRRASRAQRPFQIASKWTESLKFSPPCQPLRPPPQMPMPPLLRLLRPRRPCILLNRGSVKNRPASKASPSLLQSPTWTTTPETHSNTPWRSRHPRSAPLNPTHNHKRRCITTQPLKRRPPRPTLPPQLLRWRMARTCPIPSLQRTEASSTSTRLSQDPHRQVFRLGPPRPICFASCAVIVNARVWDKSTLYNTNICFSSKEQLLEPNASTEQQ